MRHLGHAGTLHIVAAEDVGWLVWLEHAVIRRSTMCS